MSRRNFIVGSAAAAAALSSKNVLAHGIRPDQIKVGLIGCGGRGTGAMHNAVEATDEVVVWAMADVFPDRMASSKRNLLAGVKEKFQVTDDRSFIGFDAYKQLLATDIDVHLSFPDGFDVFEANGFMEEPKPPHAPGRPRTSAEIMNEGLNRSLRIPPGLGQPIEFDHRVHPRIVESGSYDVSYSVQRLKHGHSEDLEPVLVIFRDFDEIKSFNIKFWITAVEIPAASEGKLHFVVE